MKPNFSLRLRVFNLNYWGIPYLSKHRAERLTRLGDFLNMESFDLALLQEVWSEYDFQYLKQKLSPTYPAAHYFRSGIIGSGLCVFSKHPIQELTQHVYTLNGYPYMIHHGDWFCGKAVGLLVLHLNGLVVNAYVTHLHAEYSRQRDIYLAHRVAQAWELAHFIHHTSKKADVVLLCGDLNMHPKDLGCRLLKEWTGLCDAYLEAQDFQGAEDGCTMVPGNCYVSQQDLELFPCGIRIDYVLYKAVSGLCISCKTFKTTTGHDPNHGGPLSDHEALMATLCVRHSPPQQDPSPTSGPGEKSPLTGVLREAWSELGQGMAQARWWATFASYVIGLGLLLLALLCALAAREGAKEVAILLWTPNVGLVLGAGVVYLFHIQEAKGLCRAQAELQHVLGQAKEAQEPDQEREAAPLQGLREGEGLKEQ
ncbi:sphingomyelin phosphodiesterase 2-like isoform X2 [Ochotona curzoniae]|uniref:sphingomyelin phosphodiesterase 2 isoform X2 n=1 Tax=Ochotona curzoniae TaxID=130825 RepID=UPI001B3480F5|nr:sphingomyelin phosphodiesterase 2 isoform X2 [Ochotona curzoniae]XP_040852438.1 sphingomyelin phosphodiesterase 2-like isoform X2 [Ochotona curzoniae]